MSARVIVMSGLPASGKSTLGQKLSNRLSLPFLDKDDILEALFEREGIGDHAWRSDLSRRADETLIERASALPGAVVASWWRHPHSNIESGTSTEWLARLPAKVIEVHCVCDAKLAVARFVARRRHSGHLDAQYDESKLLASFRLQAALGPLCVGRTFEVDTNVEPVVDQLVAEISEL